MLADAQPAAIVLRRRARGYSFADALPSLLPDLPTVRGCLLLDAAGRARDELGGEARTRPPTAPLAGRGRGPLHVGHHRGAEGRAASRRGSARRVGAAALAQRLELSPTDVTALIVPASRTPSASAACWPPCPPAARRPRRRRASRSTRCVAGDRGHGVNVLHGSPALFARLLATAPEALAAVRTGLVAGAHCPPVVLERLDAAGPTILNVYGMTEIGAAPRLPAATTRRSCATRRVGPGPAGLRVPVGDGGGPRRARRAPGARPARDARLHRQARRDGRGVRRRLVSHRRPRRRSTSDGYVRVVGRAKEVVHVGGFNVFPAEVEAFLLTHPDVSQAVVVGVPHERMGEVLAAYVVPRPGAELTPATLLRFARPQIAGYKLPYAIAVVDELPLLPSGKPDRVACSRRRGAQPRPRCRRMTRTRPPSRASPCRSAALEGVPLFAGLEAGRARDRRRLDAAARLRGRRADRARGRARREHARDRRRARQRAGRDGRLPGGASRSVFAEGRLVGKLRRGDVVGAMPLDHRRAAPDDRQDGGPHRRARARQGRASRS